MKKDTQEEIKRLVAMTPALPEDFEQWCEKQMKRPLIYYKRNGKEAQFKCGACGKTYFLKTADMPEYGTLEVETPRKGHPARCVYCGNQSFYEWMRVTRREQERKRFYLFQLTEEKTLIVRIFDYFRGSSVDRERYDCLTEMGRFFLEYGQVKKLIRMYSYNQDENAWELKKTAGYPCIDVLNGATYPGWKEMVEKSTLKYCPLKKLSQVSANYYGRGKTSVAVTDALMTYANNPAVEMYSKMHLDKLVQRLVIKESIYGPVNRRKNTMNGQLRLKKKENINRLVRAEGEPSLLEVLQYEEKMGFCWKEEQEKLLAAIWDKNVKDRVTHLLRYMSIQQLCNRIEKYRVQIYGTRQSGYLWEQTLITYDDYLLMREELGYDMSNEVFLYPKDLAEKHQEMVEERNKRKDELLIPGKNKQFPHIAERYESLCRRYQAAAEGYIIRPAKDAGEIILEGRKLHHCVGGDHYLSSHDAGKTTILFLRKEKRPKTPYITIEIKGNRIIQWYGAHDRKPDPEFFDRYLKEYEKQLEQREKKTKKVQAAAG